MGPRRPRRSEGRGWSRIQQGLDERSSWWGRALDLPLLWGLVAVVGCTWLLLPAAGARLPEWVPGELASFDVIVPQELTLPDDAATEAMREEARAAVLPVYDMEPRIGQELVADLGVLFTACREQLAAGELEADELAAASGLRISAGTFGVLRSASCSQGLERALAEVLAATYRFRVVDDLRALERRGEGGVVIRNLATETERITSVGEFAGLIDLRSGLEDTLRTGLMEQDAVPRRWIKPTLELLQSNLGPDLVFNRAETARRVQLAADQVQPRSQVFRRGQVLIRRGDTVTPAVARTLRLMHRSRSALASATTVSGIALVVVVMLLGWHAILKQLPAGVERRGWLSMILILMTVFVALNRLAVFMATAIATSGHGPSAASVESYLWAVPYAAGPVTVALLLGTQPAALFAVCTALTVGLMLDGGFVAVVFSLVSGLTAVLLAPRFTGRSTFSRLGLLVGLANVVMVAILELYRGLPVPPAGLGLAAVCALVGGPLAVGVATLLLPLLEGLFGITTDLRLLELSNQNLPLLKRLSLEAPGTYQHSLAVSNLAEAGADAVGCNALMLRVCAYYHDLGKLLKPDYFIENQRGDNPHDTLSPSMSALVIISHVKEGLALARRERLPLPIRQAVATHHGTKLIRFFYSKAKERSDPDKVEVRESEYRYPGPKPHTKELGILLLADAVEAAARTLESPTTSRIQSMIDRIFSDTLEDGQLDSSELTFRELDRVASAFLWVLTNMYHHRIDYPGFDFNRRQTRRDSGPIPLGTKAVTTGS